MSDENKELSQDEIERLLQQAQGGGAAGGGASQQEQPSQPEQPQPAAQQPAAAAGGDEDAVLDQDEIEKLLAQKQAGGQSGQQPPQQPAASGASAPPAAEDDDSSEVLSQDAIEQLLAKAQLVQSRRGQGGGFTLAREPHEITIWDIVQAVDPIQRIDRCPLDVENHTNLCPLHRRLDQALAGVEEAFRSTSLAQLIAETGTDSPFCPEEGPPLLALSVAVSQSSGGRNKRKKPQRKRTTARRK